MSYRIPQIGEVWHFRHLPASRGLVDIVDPAEYPAETANAIARPGADLVAFRYHTSGRVNVADLIAFVRNYELAPTAPVDLGGAA